MTMAQRAAGQVLAILADHEGVVQTAWVPCASASCGARFTLVGANHIPDGEVATLARAEGWKFVGYGQWLCPKHVKAE